MTAAAGTPRLFYHSLSALTDGVVNHLYNIDSANPQARPIFLFLVGAPGAGKSSGHARAIATGLLPPTGYATLNVDTLLESLAPFRAASAMAQLLKTRGKTRNLTKFATISAYGTRKENLGLFKWYNTAHSELAAADPETIAAFNTVRAQFADLTDREAKAKLLDLHDAALDRAMEKGVPIVYETTLSLNKSGRVTKVDDIMDHMPAKYIPVMWHIKANLANLPARIKARQEKQMPADPFPYYRYIPAKLLEELAVSTATAFEHIQTSSKYADIRKRLAIFDSYENPFNADRLARLPSPPPFTEQRNQIVRAYGPGAAGLDVDSSLAAMMGSLTVSPRPAAAAATGGASAVAAPALPPVSPHVREATETLKELLGPKAAGLAPAPSTDVLGGVVAVPKTNDNLNALAAAMGGLTVSAAAPPKKRSSSNSTRKRSKTPPAAATGGASAAAVAPVNSKRAKTRKHTPKPPTTGGGSAAAAPAPPSASALVTLLLGRAAEASKKPAGKR